MVCKPTSTAKVRRAAGFTLAEYMVAMSIGVMVLAAAVVLWAFATRTCATLLNYVELSIASKNTLDTMSREIRNATGVNNCTANQLVILDPDGVQVTYDYSATDKALTQTKGAEIRILLKECSAFQFKMYQRTPASGTDVLTETTSTNTAKVVQMQWTCGRRLTGDTTNVQSQLSSKVVIRSK